MNRCAGITVVEATIVVAILLLLAAISFPAFLQNRQRQNAAVCAMNLDTISAACRRYAQDKGCYPATIDQLVPVYLIQMPVCPSGGAYSIGSPEGDPPSCSISGHHL